MKEVFLVLLATVALAPTQAPAVHPLPDLMIAEEDAEQAVIEIEAREPGDELIRETIPSPPRRPDLNYDVVSGIQSRHLSAALRRR